MTKKQKNHQLRVSEDALSLSKVDELSDQDGCVSKMLNDRKIKDSAEVALGIRSQQSLICFPKGHFTGFTFSTNPESEFHMSEFHIDGVS